MAAHVAVQLAEGPVVQLAYRSGRWLMFLFDRGEIRGEMSLGTDFSDGFRRVVLVVDVVLVVVVVVVGVYCKPPAL